MFNIKYIELKTGWSDDGPAWIGHVKESRSGATLYFNDHAFQHCRGAAGNYVDIESGEIYWISGVKKNGEDRHWAGHGKVSIDRKVVPEYCAITGQGELDPQKYEIVDVDDCFPVERVMRLQNEKRTDNESGEE
jgi:hypothetical protein